MYSLVLLKIFVLQHLWILINAVDDVPTPTNIPILGKSPCMYSGSFDPTGYYCPDVPFPVTSLPIIECSSFIYDGVVCDENLEFKPSDADLTNMDNLRNSGKKLYIYYSHGCLQSWMKATDPSSVPNEAAQLTSFLRSNLAEGLILKDLNYIYDGNLDYHVDPNFSNSLRDYVTVMKQKIPSLKIGLYVNASNIIYYSSDPKSPDWFDFTVLNDCMDYYVIGFDKFNPCNDHFRGGIVPVNPICGFNNSLTKLSNALYNSMIAKEKIYIEFSANPTTNGSPVLPVCAVTYQKDIQIIVIPCKKYTLTLQLCEDSKYMKIWCADNSDSFYDKGKFAKDTLHAQGIIVKYIDTIDPTAACECDSRNQFITFKMMLRGFLDADRITDCLKLNSIAAEEPKCTGDPATATPASSGNTFMNNLYGYFTWP